MGVPNTSTFTMEGVKKVLNTLQNSLVDFFKAADTSRFDPEYSGKYNSKSPTFVVAKVPLEVCHCCGFKLSLAGMYLWFSGWLNNWSPSEPLSNRTLQTLLDFSALFICI